MKVEIQRVLELQSQYTSTASPAMRERGELIRNVIPGWLADHAAELGAEMGANDFFGEGRDGTGRKTRVPWVRFGARSKSPRATEGFYVVYLFDALGGAVHLSLNQGTTDFIGSDFVPKPFGVIADRVEWARDVLGDWLSALDGGEEAIELHDPGLGAGYERGNVAAVTYEADSIPDDAVLLSDARAFAKGIGRLYEEHAKHPIPHESPELREAEEAADRTSGKVKPAPRAGFRTNAAEIKAIEMHAVALARTYYEEDGWKVKELGKPFDLEVKKDGKTLDVEVKGTSSDGSGVPLTAGEVRHHKKAYPDNALVVVRGIVLDRDASPPKASGGTLYELRGWKIDPAALRVISYAYEIPPGMYEGGGVRPGASRAG